MKIVIVGGYGAVGRIISERLSVVYPNEVVVAGRNLAKAQMLAEELENKIIPYQLDVNHPEESDLWKNAELLIMCLDQQDSRFVEFCIERGIHYIDISANYTVLQQIQRLDEKARTTKTSIVLSVGLAPGISNLLAQHGVNQLKSVENIELFVLLGLGEKHGDHAFEWTFDNFHTEYSILENDKPKLVKSFTYSRKTELEGKRSFYLFDFSDQHVLAKTTAAKSVSTRMAFDVNFITQTVGFLRKLGFTKIFSNKSVQRFLIPVFKAVGLGSDIYGVKAVVTDASGNQHESTVSGYGEGRITAIVAAKTAEYLLRKPIKSGVSHLHEIIEDIPEFLRGLDKNAKVNLA
jgi:saccharopine dehydrogenase (NAD+, L-lysine-forming)